MYGTHLQETPHFLALIFPWFDDFPALIHCKDSSGKVEEMVKHYLTGVGSQGVGINGMYHLVI